MNKKVVSVVLNNFVNDSRVIKESIWSKKENFDITVVALHEGSLNEFEENDGIKVHRVRLKSRNWSKNKIIQVFKYIEFCYKTIKSYKKSDIIHCNDLNTLPIGAIIKMFFNRKVKIVYDAHEYEIEKNGLTKVTKVINKIVERLFIGSADKVITVSDKIAEEYQRLYNIQKPDIVLNAPPYQDVEKKNIFRENFNIPQEKTVFLYQGFLCKGRGIEILIEVFKKEEYQNSAVVFMGYGPLEGLILENSKESNNIFLQPAVTADVLLNYTSSADYGISFIEDISLSDRYCLPNKLFEYLMAGLPVIVSNLPEMKKLVEQEEVGVVAEVITVESLEKSIQNILSKDYQTLQSNVNKAKKQYSWEEQEKVLSQVYGDLV